MGHYVYVDVVKSYRDKRGKVRHKKGRIRFIKKTEEEQRETNHAKADNL